MITKINNNYVGLSTDIKPIRNIEYGSIFFEQDTGYSYNFRTIVIGNKILNKWISKEKEIKDELEDYLQQGLDDIISSLPTSTVDWKLSGNVLDTSVADGTEFIGSTNNKSLVFKVNNMVAGKIPVFVLYRCKELVYGLNNFPNKQYADQSTIIGNTNLLNVTGSIQDVIVGSNNFLSLLGGNGFNVGIGNNIANNLTQSFGNLFIGNYAADGITLGNYNIILGAASSFKNGDNNIILDTGSIPVTEINWTGNQNVVIGRFSKPNATVNNNLMLGNNNGQLFIRHTGTDLILPILQTSVGNAAFTQILTRNPTDGTIRTELKPSTLYSANGTLTTARVVTMGVNRLSFNSSATTTPSIIINANSQLTGDALTIYHNTGQGIVLDGTGNSITSFAGRSIIIKTGTTGAVTLDSGTTGQVNIGTGANQKNILIGNSAVNTRTSIGGTNPQSTLQVEGSFATRTVQNTNSYTILGTDRSVKTSVAGLIYTLPNFTSSARNEITITNENLTSEIFVVGTINGTINRTFRVPANTTIFYKWDGTKWVSIGIGNNYTQNAWLYRNVKNFLQIVSTTVLELTLNTLLGSGGAITNDGSAPVGLVATNPSGLSSRFMFDSTTTNYYSPKIILRASGTIVGGAGVTSNFLIEIRRGDGTTVVASKVFSYVGKITGTTFTNEELLNFETDIFSGGTDLFQGINTSPTINGFRLFISKISGNNMTITNIDIRIKK